MKTFKNLEKLYRADRAQDVESKKFYILNGYFPTWAEEHRTNADRGIKAYATELRWAQYQRGEITREQIVTYATNRMVKQEQKRTEKGLARLETVANAPELENVFISVDWMKSRTWGYCPRVETTSNGGRFGGYASGCGYDKQSAAVAEAFNKDNTMLKVLYTLKEQGLANGETDTSGTACTGHDNRKIIGYGAGYDVLPHYEGGVGIECFLSILKKAGYVSTWHGTKNSDFYEIRKAV